MGAVFLWLAFILSVWVLQLVVCLTIPAVAEEPGRKLKSGSPPEYPALARKLNIKGVARVQITITKDGRVKGVKELGGNPVLLSALVEAVKKWRYEASDTETVAEVKFEFQ
jgi:TonB family protein